MGVASSAAFSRLCFVRQGPWPYLCCHRRRGASRGRHKRRLLCLRFLVTMLLSIEFTIKLIVAGPRRCAFISNVYTAVDVILIIQGWIQVAISDETPASKLLRTQGAAHHRDERLCEAADRTYVSHDSDGAVLWFTLVLGPEQLCTLWFPQVGGRGLPEGRLWLTGVRVNST